MALLKRFTPAAGLDDLFVSRYDQLLAWARQLVGRDRAAAADLVHDAFLRLSLRGIDFRSVENIDGYLFVTLRNVHLSHVRRRDMATMGASSLLDHESIQASLAMVGASERREAARQELVLIARYAALRKETSKGASALLLRFFHGYYPAEIAAILQTTTPAVDVRLRIARLEAQAFIAHPDRLRTLDRNGSRRLLGMTADDTDFVSALRASMFDADRGSCLPEAGLERMYADAHDDAIDVRTLAHVVSCRDCLDRVNRWLGLPMLAERDPSERLGRGGRNGSGGQSSGSGEGERHSPRAEMKTRLGDVLDDRPKELRIVINGLFVGSQAVQYGISEQRLKVLIGERVGFIEIFSEHSTCLLYLDVLPPPDGPAEQGVSVALSDGRALSTTVTFHDAAPVVHVQYRDPAPEDAEHTVRGFALPDVTLGQLRPPDDRHGRRRRIVGRLADAFMWRPAFGAVALCVAGAIAWAFWSGKNVSASELLHTASLAESSPLPPGVATHQLLTMEHRLSPAAQVISRQRIEVWRDDARGMTVERVFDEQNRVVAGVWTHRDGARTVYRAGERPSVQVNPAPIGRVSLRDAWQHLPSATGFRAFVGLVEDAALEVRASEYVLRYRPMPSPENGLLEVSLTLTKADRRATAATMLLREDGQIHYVTFSETTLRRVRTESVRPDVFTPDLPLLGSAERSSEAPREHPAAVERPAPALTAQYLDELEVQSMHRLHRVGLWAGYGATITRLATGLAVSAVVPSEEVRSVVRRELGTLANPREITLDVRIATASDSAANSPSPVIDAVSRRRTRLSILRSLIDDWPEVRLRQLPLELVVTWQVMVQEHAEAIGVATRQIARQLGPSLSVSTDAAGPPGETDAFLSTLTDARDAVRQLSVLVESQDGALLPAFSSCAAVPCAAPDLTGIGASFPAIDALASRFSRFYLKVSRPPAGSP